MALALLAASHSQAPLLVWNASSSSPRGLYMVVSGKPRVGDFAIAWPPAAASAIARERGYLPAGVPLVKTVAASAGEPICARSEQVWAGQRIVAVRKPADAVGRPLPWWSGCKMLERGDLLLLGSHPDSFDGRYFGPVGADQVIGSARLLWAV